MKKLTIVLSAILLLLVFTDNSFGQGKYGRVGKRYSKEKAMEMYGPVKRSTKIDTKKLKEACEKAGDYILFSFKKNELKVYNSKRVELYPVEGNRIDDAEPLKMWSTSMVLETLENGSQEETFIENRTNVMTITNGATTLEVSSICPPICAEQ